MVSKKQHWTDLLNKALEEDRFQLYYQPIIPLFDSSTGIHREVLLRLVDENGEFVLPTTFIPLAEKYKLISKIDCWVVNELFNMIHETGCTDTFSINLSGKTLTNTTFIKFIHDQLKNSNVSPGQIIFEITETSAISDYHKASKLINSVQNLGCRFSLDDFGIGMSSFFYLKSLPINIIKIDGNFIKDIDTDPINEAMVRAIFDVGNIMNTPTVAEFVETKTEFSKLKEIGIDFAQGYYISKPKHLTTETIDSISDENQFLYDTFIKD